MKTRIILLLLLCNCALFSCAQKEKGVLPVLIQSNDSLLKIEISYDDKNRITFFEMTNKSPFDSAFINISTSELTYKGDSLIIEHNSQTIQDTEKIEVREKIYFSKDSVSIVSDNKLISRYIYINDKNQLIESKTTSVDVGETAQIFEYDEKGRLTMTRNNFPGQNIYSESECIYSNEARLDALSRINAPDWLLTYLFNILRSCFVGVQSWTMLSSFSEEKTVDTFDLNYVYNNEGYPVSVSYKDKSLTTLNITYTAAK